MEYADNMVEFFMECLYLSLFKVLTNTVTNMDMTGVAWTY